MADNPNEHNAHAKSLAFLNEQGKVSGFEMPSQEHVSKNPSDLAEIAEAQIVTTNKDSYVEQEQVSPDLQSGPPKKYIDNPTDDQSQEQQQQSQQSQAVPLSNFAHAALHSKNETTIVNNTDISSGGQGQAQGQQGGSLDAFAPSTDDKEKQNYESFFADDNNTNEQTTNNNDNPTDDLFAGMGTNDNDNNDNNQTQDDNAGGGDDENEEEKQEDKQTFLRYELL